MKAVRWFKEQKYERKDLLVLADGEDVRHCVPDDPQIRLVQIEEGRTIGEKRNFGAQLANGDVIAHWDDDDYSGPDRLRDQIDRLVESGKAVTGYSKMFFTNGAEWWLFSRSDTYGIGTSLCYWKRWWLENPFPPEQVGEDEAFQKRANMRFELTSCPAGNHLVASIHEGNTSVRRFDPSGWRKIHRPTGIGSPCD